MQFDSDIKIWSCSELKDAFLPIYHKLVNEKHSHWFHVKVDPIMVPNYYYFIKNPIALCDIKSKLECGDYKEPWEVITDFWLMFDNCFFFNSYKSEVFKNAESLLSLFKELSNDTMQRLGYCCGVKYKLSEKIIFCGTDKTCQIKFNSKYYQCTKGEKEYVACDKCFNRADVCMTMSDSQIIAKTQFNLMTHDIVKEETFISCTRCNRKFHTICALLAEESFQCPNCQTTSESKLASQYIQPTALGDYIEKFSNSLLVSLTDRGAPVNPITIREFNNDTFEFEIKDKIVNLLPIDVQKKRKVLNYNARAIYAFQKIGDDEIIFFGMHCQEYSPKTDSPNSGCIYLTYLDSVAFMEPRQGRTAIYHQIITSYLDWMRVRDFTELHIWVCPADIGNDYLFYQHPLHQKMPKKDRLYQWYIDLLDMCTRKNIIKSHYNIEQYYRDQCLKNVTDVKYFDGDYWHKAVETLLKEIEREKQADDLSETEFSSSVHSCDKALKNKNKNRKRRNRPKSGTNGKRRKIAVDDSDDVIIKRLFEQFGEWRSDFIVAALLPHPASPDMHDKQHSAKFTGFIESRDLLLSFCRDNDLEFCSIRRAKYSTLKLMLEAHKERQKPVRFYCNNCSANLDDTRYNCAVCIDFDFCEQCFEINNHEHLLIKMQIKQNAQEPMDVTPEASKETSSKLEPSKKDDDSQPIITKTTLLQALTHSVICNDQECKVDLCESVKLRINHYKTCPDTISCRHCKQIINLFKNHTLICKVQKCSVPFCNKSKEFPTDSVHIYPCGDNSCIFDLCLENIWLNCPVFNFETPKFTEDSIYWSENTITEKMSQIVIRLKESKISMKERRFRFRSFMEKNPHFNDAFTNLRKVTFDRISSTKSDHNTYSNMEGNQSLTVDGQPITDPLNSYSPSSNFSTHKNSPNNCEKNLQTSSNVLSQQNLHNYRKKVGGCSLSFITGTKPISTSDKENDEPEISSQQGLHISSESAENNIIANNYQSTPVILTQPVNQSVLPLVQTQLQSTPIERVSLQSQQIQSHSLPQNHMESHQQFQPRQNLQMPRFAVHPGFHQEFTNAMTMLQHQMKTQHPRFKEYSVEQKRILKCNFEQQTNRIRHQILQKYSQQTLENVPQLPQTSTEMQQVQMSSMYSPRPMSREVYQGQNHSVNFQRPMSREVYQGQNPSVNFQRPMSREVHQGQIPSDNFPRPMSREVYQGQNPSVNFQRPMSREVYQGQIPSVNFQRPMSREVHQGQIPSVNFQRPMFRQVHPSVNFQGPMYRPVRQSQMPLTMINNPRPIYSENHQSRIVSMNSQRPMQNMNPNRPVMIQQLQRNMNSLSESQFQTQINNREAADIHSMTVPVRQAAADNTVYGIMGAEPVQRKTIQITNMISHLDSSKSNNAQLPAQELVGDPMQDTNV